MTQHKMEWTQIRQKLLSLVSDEHYTPMKAGKLLTVAGVEDGDRKLGKDVISDLVKEDRWWADSEDP